LGGRIIRKWLQPNCRDSVTTISRSDVTTTSSSDGRRDAAEPADSRDQDLSLFGYEVWRDNRKIRSGKDFESGIEDGRTPRIMAEAPALR